MNHDENSFPHLLPESRRLFLQRVAGTVLAVAGGTACARNETPAGGAASNAAPAAGSLASPAAPSASASAKAAGQALRIGYLPITDATPLLVAHGRGLFQAEGLEVERPALLRSWPQVAEAFQSRKVDVVHLLMPMTVWLRFGQNFPLKVIAWDHVDGSALTVAPSVNKLEDLIGRVIAVPFWYSIHNVILQQLLKKAGITPVLTGEPAAAKRETKLVVMAPPDMPPALANGSISAFIVADPFNALAEVNKVGKILRFTGDVWQHHACCVVVAHQSDVETRPEWVQKIVTAIAKAQVYARENRDATATLLSKDGQGYLPQPRPAIARALSHYDAKEYEPLGAIKHKDFTRERIDFAPFPYPSYTERLVTLLKETKVEGDNAFLAKLDPATVHAALVEDRFARVAIEAAGGAARFGLAGLERSERLAP